MFKTPQKTVSSQSNLPHFPFLLWHLALKWQKIIHLCNNFITQFPWDGAISLALLFFFLTVIRNCVKKNYKNNRRTENEKGLTWTLITIRATDKRLDCYNVIADWAKRPTVQIQSFKSKFVTRETVRPSSSCYLEASRASWSACRPVLHDVDPYRHFYL